MNEFVRGIVARLGENFAPDVLGAQLARLLSSAIAAGLTFLAYYAAWRLLDALLRPALRRTRLDTTSREFARTVIRFLVLTVGAVAALSEMGIGTTSLLASLGVAGITLGLVREDPDFMEVPPPRVVVTALGDYHVTLQLQAWLEDERRHIPRRFELRERVFEALRKAGVDMPTETIRVTGLPPGAVPSGSPEPA
jgi:small-conductance mechanosensitive channel